jgi:hypothetical protein
MGDRNPVRYAARVVFGGSERRDMRLELHQHQPPTTRTGTTYSIEMYQCVKHASETIPQNAITRSPRFIGRLLRSAHAGRRGVFDRGSSTAEPSSACAPPAHVQRERQAEQGNRHAERDYDSRRM